MIYGLEYKNLCEKTECVQWRLSTDAIVLRRLGISNRQLKQMLRIETHNMFTYMLFLQQLNCIIALSLI